MRWPVARRATWQPPSEAQADGPVQNVRSKNASGKERYEKVYELAASGLTMGEIAQQTDWQSSRSELAF